MSPVVRTMRWAFHVAWLASFVWLAACCADVLGWRGPGSVFIAWSIPSLPVFVATAEWRARQDRAGVAPWVPALIAAWAAAIWWLGATAVTPRSVAQFALGTIVVVVAAVGLLAIQGSFLDLPQARAGARSARAPRATVAAHPGAR